ncbi:MAG: hypothetical protein ACR2H5_19030 [Ktedonobacteraceae bacterium]
MANIVIDPVIIKVPPDGASRAEVELWLENLTTWLKVALTAPFTWLHYRQASALLEDHEQFPSFEQLRQLQQKYRLNININQIARNVNEFFRDESLDLEIHLERLEYIIVPETGSININPEQFVSRLPKYIHAGVHLLFANCCACKQIGNPFGQELRFATLALVDGSKEILVSVVILEALPDFIRPADNKIAQPFSLLITPDDLLPLVDVMDVWAKGEHGITYAIEQQNRKDWLRINSSPFPFQLGSRFVESVNERGLDTNEIVLRSSIRAAGDVIADKAKDIAGYRLHRFRKSEAANSPQLIRESDHARAWRLMLQKHGAGWRLHYWQIPTVEGSTIEFANVCKESEREIY